MKTITISEETYENIKNQLGEDSFSVDSLEDFVGRKLFIRTVTNYLTGEVKGFVGGFIHLKNAAWIADTGRFSDAIKKGTFNEVEPVEDAFVSIGSIVDMFPWTHKLPREKK